MKIRDHTDETNCLDNTIVGRMEDVRENTTAAAKAANINFEHQIEDLQKRLILNPVNESRVIRESNQRIERQLSILKAVRDLVYGKVETIAEAAQRYGAQLRSVQKFLQTGENYKGKIYLLRSVRESGSCSGTCRGCFGISRGYGGYW